MTAGNSQQAFLPLRGLGNLLAITMAAILAAIGAWAVIMLVGLDGASPPANPGRGLEVAINLAIFAWSIAFVVWFRRARINAESHGYWQRRARGWTFWGWVIPIVNVWIPFQLMGDIWRAGLPPERRQKTAWMPGLWWTAWLLSEIYLGRAAMENRTGPPPHIGASTPALNIAFLLTAGALLIAIVRAVSNGPVGAPPLVIGPTSIQPRSGDTRPLAS